MDRLPDLGPVDRERERATGSDGSVLADCLARNGADQSVSVLSGAVNQAQPQEHGERPESAKARGETAENESGGASKSNRPGLRFSQASAVLKTVPGTSLGSTPEFVFPAQRISNSAARAGFKLRSWHQTYMPVIQRSSHPAHRVRGRAGARPIPACG